MPVWRADLSVSTPMAPPIVTVAPVKRAAAVGIADAEAGVERDRAAAAGERHRPAGGHGRRRVHGVERAVGGGAGATPSLTTQ